jgi:penicillin-binding protein 1B
MSRRRPLPLKKTPVAAPAGRLLRVALRLALRAGVALLILLLLYAAYLDAAVTRAFEAHRWTLPARVHGRGLELQAGMPFTAAMLRAELAELGYREVRQARQPGEFSVAEDGAVYALVTRGFRFPDAKIPSQSARVTFSAARVEQLVAAGRSLRLEPPEIAALRAQDAEDRVLMRLAERPPYLVEALLATEDREFAQHIGVSPRGLLRAFWVNVSAGEVQQGGSTLTQQLVKNLFLGNERTLLRKLNEAIMAVLLEVHYDKQTILETYCNEIYLGQAGRRAVHGFALASRFYFGRPVSELQLHEVALLVGLVKGPSQYNPWKQPQRAQERRDVVLAAMRDTGVISAAEAAMAMQRPLGVLAAPSLKLNRFPSYMALVRRELRQQLDAAQLGSEGLMVFTALDPRVQQAAEAAVVATLPAIEGEKAAHGLEAALVVASPATGEVTAAVGGRDVDFAGFDRVASARRTIGSLMKPVVLLTALQRPGEYSLATFVSDAPLSVEQRGSPAWRPANYDHVSHGEAPDHQVMLIDVIAHSWNLSTARLGMNVGVDNVIAQARRLGVTAELPPYPAVLLGSATLSPLEVLAMYQPMASAGVRRPLTALRGVVDGNGQVLYRRNDTSQRVTDPATAFLLTYALQETFRSGTARSAYGVLPPALAAAGKTGTTDNGRDSWFAGYTGSHLAVAWTGRDDYKPTSLSGASGALRIWTDFMARLPQQPLPAEAPEGVEWGWLEPGGQARSAEGCAGAAYLPVLAGNLPSTSTLCGKAGDVVEGTRGFLQRLFD